MLKKGQSQEDALNEFKDVFQMLYGYAPSEPESASEGILESGKGHQDIIYQVPVRNAKLVSRFTPGTPSTNHPHGHFGIDLGQEKGAPIYAIGPGIVSNVGVDPKGGNFVTTYHENGKVKAYYAHMDSINVEKGQQVDGNTPIGTVGNSGNASRTAPHLHLEVSVGGKKIDPLSLLR